MGKVVHFPAEARINLGFERVKSSYSPNEISNQFGISRRYLERWSREGIIPSIPGPDQGTILFDFRALTCFRRVRELRTKGLTLRQIDAELHGQMNLFPEPLGVVVALPSNLSPFEEALLLHERKDPRAAGYYHKAIIDDDYAEDAYCNLGIMEFEAGNLSKAFDCFTQALRSDPRHFEAHFNLAYLYFETGDLRLARMHYELAAEIDPAVESVYFNLGLVDAMSGDLTSAVSALSKARNLASEEQEGRIDELLSAIQTALRRPDQTRRLRKKSISESSTSPDPE